MSKLQDFIPILDKALSEDKDKQDSAVKVLKDMFTYDAEMRWNFMVQEKDIENFTIEDVKKFLDYGKRHVLGMYSTRKPKWRAKR